MALELKNMYDLYGACAGRMADLLDWVDETTTPAQSQQHPMTPSARPPAPSQGTTP